jgi:hypothetical protein
VTAVIPLRHCPSQLDAIESGRDGAVTQGTL